MTSEAARRSFSWAAGMVVLGTLCVGVAACGSERSPSTQSPGETLARENGCASCHGGNFSGGVGPSWVGLAGSDVQLADGSTVVADTAYLTRAIAEPGADQVKSYGMVMPANNLSSDEIAAIVAFIESL